ncbi:MAG: hypothetical protein HY663_02110 [Chloroflexi bacterium]|nr:hypothetical protein [Chloroflexota bacterium]
MSGLKVFLFISFLVVGSFGMLALFSPSLLAQMGMPDASPDYIRLMSGVHVGLAIALWYAFRNPLQSLGVIIAAIVGWSLEAVVLLIGAIAGIIAWGSALPGVIFYAILAGGLVYFYPRGEKAS